MAEKTWAVDYQALKQSVSITMVLDWLGVKLKPAGPNRFRGRCPLPSHTSGRSQESFTVTTDRGTGGVWSCKSDSCVAARAGKSGGNQIDLVAAMKDCSFHEAALMVQQQFGLAGPPAGATPANAARPAEQPLPELPKLVSEGTTLGPNKPLGFRLKDVNPEHAYLMKRGISTGIAEQYGVGFFPGKGSMAGRIVFPLYQDVAGDYQLVGYAGRSTIEDDGPRWIFPKGLVKSFLWGMDKVARDARHLVLVESFWGVLAVRQAGAQNVAALMGRSLTDGQFAQLKATVSAAADIVVMLDGNRPGREAADKLVLQLCPEWFVKRVDLLADAQPDHLAPQELARLLY